jgi:N utilization substance protein B
MSHSENTSIPKMPPRRENRVAVVQFLYMWDINPSEDLQKSLRLFFDLQDKQREFYSFAEHIIQGVLNHLTMIDDKIRENVRNWNFSRIAKTDLAILRMAVYELLFRQDIPPIVSINEAIEISKLLSETDSKRFINGILDKVKDQLIRPLREGS